MALETAGRHARSPLRFISVSILVTTLGVVGVLTTNLYIPFLNLKINDEDGYRILYENLIQSGPAYKLIVHYSPDWVEMKDKLPWPEMIEIIPEKKAEEYKRLAHQFFVPIASKLGLTKKITKDNSLEFRNMTKLVSYRQVLAYSLIAHDHKARILDHNVLQHSRYERLFPRPNERALYYSDRGWHEELGKIKNGISEDEKAPIDFIEGLIWGYKKDSVPTLSVNKDARIFNDLMDLLEKERVRMLSEENSLFSLVNVRKDILKRKIRVLLTDVVKNAWFPYLTSGVTLIICYIASLNDLHTIISLLSGIAAKILGKYDFREFAPAFQSARLFEIADVRVKKNRLPLLSYDYFLGPAVSVGWF